MVKLQTRKQTNQTTAFIMVFYRPSSSDKPTKMDCFQHFTRKTLARLLLDLQIACQTLKRAAVRGRAAALVPNSKNIFFYFSDFLIKEKSQISRK